MYAAAIIETTESLILQVEVALNGPFCVVVVMRLVVIAWTAHALAVPAPLLRRGRPRAAATSIDEGSRRRRIPIKPVAAALLGAALTAASKANAVELGLKDVASELLTAGARRDSLTLLLASATIIPLAKAMGLSPILGFMATGVSLGPNGLGVVTELSTTEQLAELGVIFFLFEMGLELSLETLGAMKKEIFGLGLAQFLSTSVLAGIAASMLSGGSIAASVCGLVGGALALSSSAFVLQLLRDQDELGTTHGRASLGVLLLQDITVVPLLVVTPLLGGGGGSLALALAAAALKAVLAVAVVELVCKRVLDMAFDRAARSRSQEAFLAVALLAALGVSSFTESIGLSDSMGAFLAGVALSETRYSKRVEADVAPFRGMLLGLFFVTVGFSIDVDLVCASPFVVTGLAAGILALKAFVLGALGLLFRLPVASAVRSGALLSQGGEFGFVMFGLAAKLGLITQELSRLLVTTVALSMAATPVVAALGNAVARKINQRSAAQQPSLENVAVCEEPQPDESSAGCVVVCGYGKLGRVVCEALDRKLQRYVVIEKDVAKVAAARRDGRPVFCGDLTQPETIARFGVADARLAVVAQQSDPRATTNIVLALRRSNPQLRVVARAKDKNHQRRLNRLGGSVVQAIVPTLKDDSKLLTFPFGGAVLRGLDFRADEVDMLIEDKRRAILGDGDSSLSILQRPALVVDEVPKSLMAQCLDDDDDDSPETTQLLDDQQNATDIAGQNYATA